MRLDVPNVSSELRLDASIACVFNANQPRFRPVLVQKIFTWAELPIVVLASMANVNSFFFYEISHYFSEKLCESII